MPTTPNKSIKTYANKLFASVDDVEQRYCDFLTFCDKQCPSKLWKELRQVQQAKDVRALAKWARSIKPKTLNNARRIVFGLTHPAGNEYGMECCYYKTESFEGPIPLCNGSEMAIRGLAGLVELATLIGIDKDDAPSADVELADSLVPLFYAALVLTDWMAADTSWFGGKKSDVYLMNFSVEAIPIGTLQDGTFRRVRKFL